LVVCIIITGCLSSLIVPVVTSNQTHRAENEGKLFVYFLDVGQGDSTLFVTEGKTILIDAGDADAGDRLVADIRKLGITGIDLLVATHPHADHIGGMQTVLGAFPVGQVLDAGVPDPSPLYEHFLETIDRKNIPYRVAEQGQTIAVDPSLRVVVLWPPARRSGDDPNDNSVVLRVSYGMTDFLMTGDLGGEPEDALVRSGFPLDAEILKVGHHGSSSSTSAAFFARVRPELAVISVGKDNPYGHPHTETINLLRNTRTAVYRTDRDGTIVIRTDGMSYSVKTEAIDPAVWTRPATHVTARPYPGFPLPSLPAPDSFRFPAFSLPPLPSNLTFPLPGYIPPQIGNTSGVCISATQFNAPGDDRQNLNGEWVQLSNNGRDTVLIAGWTLSDTSHRTLYTFPAIILVPDETITVYTGHGTLNTTALFMDSDEPVWGNEGDIAILKDGTGTLIDQRSEGGMK
jgi:competence protein ComEC